MHSVYIHIQTPYLSIGFRFTSQLPAYIPAPPEMTFADNYLKLTRRNPDDSVLELSFDALSALRQVDEKPTVDKVSCSNEWKESRYDCC